LFAGALSDRCAHTLGRRRPFIIVGVGINVVGLFLMDLAFKSMPRVYVPASQHVHGWGVQMLLLGSPTFLVFLACYVVVQFGNNVASAAFSGIIPDLVPVEQRGAASGYMALMSQLGTLLGVVGSALVLGGQTDSVKYLLIAVVMMLVTLVTVLGVKETPLPEKPPPIRWGEYLRSLWIDPKRYPDFAWVWVTRFLVMMGFYAIQPYINYYFVDVIGIEKPDVPAGELIGILLLFSSISGIGGGYLSDRIGRKRVVYLANGLIAIVVLGFIFCRSLPEVLVIGLLFGLGYGAYISVDWALGTDVLPSKVNAAKEMAVWHISMTLPQSIASPVASILIALYGTRELVVNGEKVIHYTLNGYTTVFIMSSVCFAAGAWFLRNVRGVK
jgi:MFS family permease